MNWKEIKVSDDNTFFHFDGKAVFDKSFIEVLKFHAPGLAPVKDGTGSFHIDTNGDPLYTNRYSRTFGYYCNRAAVVEGTDWFHLNETGKRVYKDNFSWTGNFQENICAVRDKDNLYFHINLYGERIYKEKYLYCGDFKDNYACVKDSDGFYYHINAEGKMLNGKPFADLGIFHKGYATAKDGSGWHHIDKKGAALYSQRYLAIEPFYNGFALVTKWDGAKEIIDEKGEITLKV